MSNARRPAKSTPEPSTTRPGARAAAAQGAASRNRLPILLGVGAVIVVALIIAIVASRGGNDSGTANGTTTQERANVTVTGTALAAATESGLIPAATDPAVGQVAPGLAGINFTGSAVTVPAAGKPTVVMFVAHWCPHCQAEVPQVQKWRDDGSIGSDVEIRTVSTSVKSTQGNYPPSSWLARVKWTAPVLVDSPENFAAQAYGLQSFPYFVAVGADGKVKMRATGELTLADFTTVLNAARS